MTGSGRQTGEKKGVGKAEDSAVQARVFTKKRAGRGFEKDRKECKSGKAEKTGE